MRTTVFRRISLMAAILFATGLVAEAQVSKFIKKAKETVTSKVEKAVDNTVGSVVGEDAGNISNSGLNVGGKPALSAVTKVLKGAVQGPRELRTPLCEMCRKLSTRQLTAM